MNAAPLVSERTSREAAKVLKSYIKPTRLVCIDSSKNIWAKLESEHPTFSFKVRPAFFGILSQLEKAKAHGVVASSSGNFAQAVAYAAQTLSCRATIIMMKSNSAYKIKNTQELGAEVKLADSFEHREFLAQEIADSKGALRLHPFNSIETLTADSTLGLEILDACSEDFDLFIPSSGGGLAGANAALVKQIRPQSKVYAVQPENNGSLRKSFEAGHVSLGNSKATLADALVASRPGENSFGLIKNYIDDVVSVSEAEIIEGLKALWYDYKIFAEPAAACSIAALRKTNGANSMKIILICGASIKIEEWEKLAGASYEAAPLSL